MNGNYNIRAKIGDNWQTVGNLRQKDGRPGYSVGLTADFVRALATHNSGWFNFDLLPDSGERKQRQEQPAHDDNPW